jgi:hypothetical protein
MSPLDEISYIRAIRDEPEFRANDKVKNIHRWLPLRFALHIGHAIEHPEGYCDAVGTTTANNGVLH